MFPINTSSLCLTHPKSGTSSCPSINAEIESGLHQPGECTNFSNFIRYFFKSNIYEYFVLILIFAEFVMMLAQFMHDTPENSIFFYIGQIILTTFYTIEIVLKALAMIISFSLKYTGKYLWPEIIVVTITWLQIIYPPGNYPKGLKFLPFWRVFRVILKTIFKVIDFYFPARSHQKEKHYEEDNHGIQYGQWFIRFLKLSGMIDELIDYSPPPSTE